MRLIVLRARAALPNDTDGAPLLQLLSAQPPRTRRGVTAAALDVDSTQWRLVRLSGDTGRTLRVGCIAAAGSGLAVATLGGEIILYRVNQPTIPTINNKGCLPLANNCKPAFYTTAFARIPSYLNAPNSGHTAITNAAGGPRVSTRDNRARARAVQ